jgi:hypothetical protein
MGVRRLRSDLITVADKASNINRLPVRLQLALAEKSEEERHIIDLLRKTEKFAGNRFRHCLSFKGINNQAYIGAKAGRDTSIDGYDGRFKTYFERRAFEADDKIEASFGN